MRAMTVSAGYASAFITFVMECGVSGEQLYKDSGLSSSDLSNPDDRVSRDAYLALIESAKRQLGDPTIALKFGAQSEFKNFSITGMIAHASADMLEAFEQLNRYGQLAMEVECTSGEDRYRLEENSKGLWLVDQRLNPSEHPAITEATWSRFICSSRRNFPDADFALEAHVTHRAPDYADHYEAIWGIPVTFASRWNAIRFSRDWLHVQIQPENRYAFGVFSERAERLLEEQRQSGAVSDQVEAIMIPMLHTGRVSVESVSEKMGLSRQTLFRKLKKEGITFATVHDQLREKMAIHYLSENKLSVNEVAYLIGFSEPGAFSRAFKRWKGTSPRDFLAYQ